MKTLRKHINNGTIPTQPNMGSSLSFLFEETILPRLGSFFKDVVLPLSGPRPTRYTRDKVTGTVVERDVANVIELDPGTSERGLFKHYGFVNGWSISH